jgi:hypothetical protein
MAANAHRRNHQPAKQRCARVCHFKGDIIFVGEWEEVPALFKNRPNDYLILCDKEANYAPKDFLSHAPQIARLNSAGIITEVPKENEELSEFLKRGDTK